MACPPEITLKNLNGIFILNKTESDEFDGVLQLQGISWLIRRAIAMMPVTLHITSYTDDEGKFHIDVVQPGAAGIKGTTEKRILDGELGDHQDHIFGKVQTTNNWAKVADITDDDKEDEALFKSKWLPESLEGDVIDNHATSVGNGWVARQIWGFQEFDGVRKYARNIVVKKGDKVERVTMVYDYKGPLKE